MTIFVIGDSHTAVFNGKNIVYTPGPITARNFCSHGNQYRLNIENLLNECAKPGDSLILCLSEIDIRAHFWRELPIFYSRGMTINEFIKIRVDLLIEELKYFSKTYAFDTVILWGAPPASLGSKEYNPDFPFVGCSKTRNVITNIFNASFIARCTQLVGEPRIVFSSPFYDMVSDEFATDTHFLPDGVHLDNQLHNSVWDRVTILLENRDLIYSVDSKFHKMKNAEVAFVEKDYTLNDKKARYNTWIPIKYDVHAHSFQRIVTIAIGQSESKFGFINAAQAMELDNSDRQLSLEII